MKLSLCIATFNEEQFIRYPLDSAYDLVDEVVIVDGGSEDKTLEIAKSYGKKVRIIQTTNPAMFHINKQKAIEAAKGEWILQLDADEALSDELRKEIRLVLGSQLLVASKTPGTSNQPASPKPQRGEQPTTNNQQPIAYYLPRKNFFLTRFLEKGGQYPDYTIRLYKNGAAHFPCKSVHENVELLPTPGVEEELSVASKTPATNPLRQSLSEASNQQPATSNQQPTTKIGYLKSPLLHYADPDFSRYLARWNRYTSLDADILFTNNQPASPKPQRGEQPATSNKPSFFAYFFWKPITWFLSTYLRHKGFQDGFPGFVFSLFSSIRFWVIYIKWWSHSAKASRDKKKE